MKNRFRHQHSRQGGAAFSCPATLAEASGSACRAAKSSPSLGESLRREAKRPKERRRLAAGQPEPSGWCAIPALGTVLDSLAQPAGRRDVRPSLGGSLRLHRWFQSIKRQGGAAFSCPATLAEANGSACRAAKGSPSLSESFRREAKRPKERRRLAAGQSEPSGWCAIPAALGTVLDSLAQPAGRRDVRPSLVACVLFIFSILSSHAEEQRVSSIELTPHARRAIDRALVYLEREQRPDGSWGLERYWVANTSLATMAFMVQGHVPGKGKYGETIEDGVEYLVSQAQKSPDGYIVDISSGTFYQHALAVMALSEAWGQSKNLQVGPAVRKATNVILKSQNQEGGWGYNPDARQPGDLSITIMGIEALVSAKEAGVLVPDSALERAKNFIYACQSKETGAFWYKPSRQDETNAYRMGAGLLGLQLAGDLDSDALKQGWKFLMNEGVKDGWAFKERNDWLDQFYCVQACYQSGDQYINFWYPKAAEKIISRQEPSGKIAGDGNMPHGGTAVATLVLAVPYRFLPIFQR